MKPQPAPAWEISEETKKAIAEIDNNIAMAAVRARGFLIGEVQ
jgi:hypothetical protein